MILRRVLPLLLLTSCPSEQPPPEDPVLLVHTDLGRITSVDGSIDCPSRCRQTYPLGTVVELTAIGDAVTRFDGWLSGCTGPSPTCRITISERNVVTAHFTDVSPGTPLWFVAFGAPGASADVEALAVAPGPTGRIWASGLVTGSMALGGSGAPITHPSSSIGTGWEAFVSTFEADGGFVLARRFPGQAVQMLLLASPDGGAVIAGYVGQIDLGGELVTNQSSLCAGTLFIAGLDDRLQRVWSNGFGGFACASLNSMIDVADGFGIGGSIKRGVDLGGGPAPDGGDSAYFVAFARTGGFLRGATAQGALFGAVSASAIAVDSAGRTVLAIDDFPSIGLGPSATAIVTLDDGGGEVARASIGGPDGGAEVGDLHTGSDGTFLVYGTFEGQVAVGDGALTARQSPDTFLARLTASGTVLWLKDLGGFSAGQVSRLPDGSIVVAGTFIRPLEVDGFKEVPLGFEDIFLMRLSENGTVQWLHRYGGAASIATRPRLATTSDGRVFCSGRFGAADGGVRLASQLVFAPYPQTILFEVVP